LLLAAVLMLDHIDRNGRAQRLRKAIRLTLNEDKRELNF
jgi:isocitrate/isopropylmalate dehydrogenase